jgi:hypothetical protein
MATLADFDLLRDVKDGVSTKPWANAQVRDAMTLHYHIKRAKEEIHRLNIEIRQQVTYMRDKHTLYHLTVQQTKDKDPDLAAYIAMEGAYQDIMFMYITFYLIKTSKLLMFSGVLKPGTRRGAAAVPMKEAPSWLRSLERGTAVATDTADTDSGEDEGEGQLVVDVVEKLVVDD